MKVQQPRSGVIGGLAGRLEPAQTAPAPQPVFPVARHPIAAVQTSWPIPKPAVVFMAVYIALQTCYAPEILITFFHIPFPIMGIAAVLLGVILIFVARWGRFFQASMSWPYVLLFMWWLLDAALFTYRGYWTEVFLAGMRFHILLPLAICGLALTMRSTRMLVFGYSIGYIVLLLVCFRYGELSDGRLLIPQTSMANPNDLALYLLLGMAMVGVGGFGKGILRRTAWILSMGAGFYYVLETGSRANLVTAAVAVFVAFLLFDRRRKLILATAGVLTGALLLLLIPRSTWMRLTTLDTLSQEAFEVDPSLVGAVASTEARKDLQIRAIRITLANPIFGVGPRMFEYALDNYMRTNEGWAKGSWQVPHNTYLHVSSESGVVGLILYCWIIVWCLRANYRCYRMASKSRDMEESARQSMNLFLTMTVYAVGTLFCSMPYTGILPTLVGITTANWLALRDAGLLGRRVVRA